MRITSKRLVGFALVLIVAFSAYLTIVQIVETFKPDGILKSFLVKSSRRSGSSSKFLMGDTLLVAAESDLASKYDLQVHINSSLVFESERSGESPLTVQIPLVPPAFTVGKSYTLSLSGFVLNSPIPGAYFTDSASYTFEVVNTQTTLGLVNKYDDATSGLYSRANLTDLDGYAVPNETVSFYLQLKSEQGLTDGWIPLGSRLTDNNGTAMICMGFPLFCQMAVKARHQGDANFGPCEKTADVEETTNLTDSSLYWRLEACISERAYEPGVLDIGTGVLSMSIDTSCPDALLPVNVAANYTSSSQLNSTWNGVVYYLDNLTGCIAWSPFTSVSGGGPFVYQTTWPWPQGPSAKGIHTLIGGVVSTDNLCDPLRNGTGIIASYNITLNIGPCPSSLVLYLPEAVYGDCLPVTVAFTRAWPYAVRDSGGFTTCSLASQITYDNMICAFGEPIKTSVPVSLNVTGSSGGTNTTMTDMNGLASFQYSLSLSGAHLNLNISCIADGSLTLFESASVMRNVDFTEVNVSDTMDGLSNQFRLNCVINGQGSSYGLGNGTICVGAENQVDMTAVLNGSSVCAAPESVLIGKPIKRDCTNASGWVSVPAGSTLLRAASLFNINTTTAKPPIYTAAADVNHDGSIDGSDLIIVSRAFGSYPGQPGWNWRADINLDLSVDGTDLILCARSFGRSVGYNASNYSGVKASFLVNGQWNEEWLDSSGCVNVTPGASGVCFSLGVGSVGAVVEFFNFTFHQNCSTDNAGGVDVSWTPSEIGSVNSFFNGGPKPYFALTWLPSSFQAVLSRWSSVTNVKDPLSQVTFLNVLKRPVSISVGYAPSQPTLDDIVTMSASCFDTALGEPATDLNVTFLVYDWDMQSFIWMGSSTTNSSGVATFSWSPRSYYHSFAYFVLDVVCGETAFTLKAEVVPVTVDTRYPTVLEFLGSPVMNVPVGSPCSFSVRLVRADNGDPVTGRNIRLYLNDTCINSGTSTGNDGICSWSPPWSPPQSGTYFFRACFSDYDLTYRPSNDARFVVVSAVIPTMVLFDVQPREFSPSTPMTLTATVLNATSNDPLNSPLQGYAVRFFEVDADGSQAQIGLDAVTNSSGVASLSWRYDSFPGVHAYAAVVATGQQMMTSPVMLTVAKETSLPFNISMNPNFNYTLSGYLLSYGVPVGNKPVGIYVNSTLKANVTTMDYYGNFSLTLNLPSANNKPTEYNIQAAFEGDSPSNATAYAHTPNGTQYAVCTTIQYGYKPSSNVTVLIVKPQSTDIVTTTKTPEQMQQDAEKSGWFRVDPEFSWWYPWFRLHYKLSVDLPQGNPKLDYGWSPLPFGESSHANSTVLGNIMNAATPADADPLALAEFFGTVVFPFVLQATMAYTLGRTIAGIAVAVLGYGTFLALYATMTWLEAKSNPAAWLKAFMSASFVEMATIFLTGSVSSFGPFLTTASRWLLGEIQNPLQALHALRQNFLDITGVIFVLMDFVAMIFYLSNFLHSI